MVPGFEVPPPPPPPPPLPQPIAEMETKNTSSPTIDSHLRRRAGMPKKNTRAKTAPPADDHNELAGLLSAVVAGVVFTVNTSVCAVVPLMATDGAARLHVGRSLAPEGELVMEQVIATAPVNPPAGVTVIREVLPVVAPGLKLILPPLVRAKLGGAVTLTVTEVNCVNDPEMPVTNTE